MKLETRISAKSHFNIMKLDSEGNEIFHSNENYNTITDYGYQRIYGGSGSTSTFPNTQSNYNRFRYAGIGTGNIEITHDNRGLGNLLSYRDGQQGTKPSAPVRTLVEEDGIQYVKVEQYFIWDLGALANVTFTEVGIFETNSGNDTMLCGQLTKNEDGVPTAITVLEDEQLVLKYTSYWPAITGVMEMGRMTLENRGVEYEVTMETIERGSTYNMVNENATTYFPSNNSNYIWTSRTPDGGLSISSSGGGNSRVVVVEFLDRIERTITLTANMLPVTTPIAAWGIPIGSGSSSSSSNPNSKLIFNPPLPKDSTNYVEFRFTWTIRWRE